MSPNMDPSHLNFLDLNEPTPPESPDLDACGEPFGSNDIDGLIGLDDAAAGGSSNQDLGAPQTPPGTGDLVPKPNAGDAFRYRLGPMETAHQGQLLVDPELYRSSNSHDEDVKSHIQVGQASISPPSARRDSEYSNWTSTSRNQSPASRASTNITLPERKPPTKRKVPKKATRLSTARGVDEAKRRLERNRVAASRCREKKKNFIKDLEERVQKREEEKCELAAEALRLCQEISALQQRLMMHSGCGDPNINGWLHTQAQTFVDMTGMEFAQAAIAYGQTPQLGLVTGPLHSRTFSHTSVYPRLDDMTFCGLDQRQGSTAYSNGSGPLYPSPRRDAALPTFGSVYPSPTEEPMFSAFEPRYPSPTTESALPSSGPLDPWASQEKFIITETKYEPSEDINDLEWEFANTSDGSADGGG